MNEERRANGTLPALTPQLYLAEYATAADVDVLVGQADFEAALNELVPSVSRAEMEHYRAVQLKFSSSAPSSKSKGKGRMIAQPQ